MSNNKAKHAVKLNIDAGYYNALMSALQLNTINDNDDFVEEANELITKIKKYARFYMVNDKRYAEIRFFEREVISLICQLLEIFALATDGESDYYDEAVNAGKLVADDAHFKSYFIEDIFGE